MICEVRQKAKGCVDCAHERDEQREHLNPKSRVSSRKQFCLSQQERPRASAGEGSEAKRVAFALRLSPFALTARSAS